MARQVIAPASTEGQLGPWATILERLNADRGWGAARRPEALVTRGSVPDSNLGHWRATYPHMIIESFPVAPLGCNCVILGDEDRKTAIVVDPGGEGPRIVARLQELGLRCEAIVHTHTHFDHIGATKDVQEATNAPTMIHEADLFLYKGVQMQIDSFGAPFRAPEMAEIDRFVADGDTVLAGGLEADVVHTPGHSPGSICLTVEGDRPVVLAGDTLFARSVGRTDLWGGNTSQLVDSVRRKLFSLPDETLVICGHGPNTTIGEERRLNPFVGER